MIKILNEKIEGNFIIREYTRDGKTVSHTVKTVISVESHVEEPTEDSRPTLDDIAEENLLETKYQTLLLEMML